MNNKIFIISLRFLILLLAQVLVFNYFRLFGFIPCVYLIFIFLYPTSNNRLLYLFVSFLLGLFVDMISDTGGVHAAASVFIAYARPVVLKFSFGVLYENHAIKFSSVDKSAMLIYISILTILHHLILYTLDTFNLSLIFTILKQILFAGLFTIVLNFLFIVLFSRKK